MIKFLTSIAFVLFSHATMAQICSSDEFVFEYYGKYQCQLGGTPEACSVIPKGTLSILLGVGGYIGGKKLGTSVGKKLGQRGAKIRADIADSVTLERFGDIGRLHSEWSRAFKAAKNGKPYEGNFWGLKNNSRWTFFEGLNNDPIQGQLDTEFLDKSYKLQGHLDGKKKLSSSELDKLQVEMNDVFERAKSHYLQKRTSSKFKWMRQGLKSSKTMGARAGSVGLSLVGAVAVPVAQIVQKDQLFNKCVVGNWGWASNLSDSGELKNFIDIDKDCSIDVKDAKLNELIDMFPAQREEFFSKCPSCCDMLQKRNLELTEKIEQGSPTVVINEGKCNEDSMTAEVIKNGNHYRHSYKKMGTTYELITGLIPNNDDVHNNNKMKISVTAEGTFTTPVISNVNAGAITSNFGIENTAAQITKWYEALPDKSGPPRESQDLADIRKVQYSVGEQIKAANLSFKSIRSFCENSQRKQKQPNSKSPGAIK